MFMEESPDNAWRYLSRKLETRNQKLETGNCELRTENQTYCRSPIQRSDTTSELPGFWGS
jgi:hypothetical protein